MGNLFNTSVGNDPRAVRQMHNTRFNAARSNLLLVVIFSLVNILLLTTNSGVYFLFSASIPYLLVDIGMLFCGRYPDEFYTGDFEGMLFADPSLFWILLVIALLMIGVYLLCWYLSRKGSIKPLVFALVFFILDTIFMLLVGGLSQIANLLFHIWAIVIFIMGINSQRKLRALAGEEPIEAEFTDITEGETPADSPILRQMDTEVKSRVLLDAEVYNYHIVYRRVKKTNELVINGNVYAEYIATAEMPHELTARVDGHQISAGLEMGSHSYISVDGNTVKRKMRWI